jgi:hypothetical protein
MSEEAGEGEAEIGDARAAGDRDEVGHGGLHSGVSSFLDIAR